MDTRPQRTWFKKDDSQTKSSIILCHAPLTFGHSQLIIKFISSKNDFTESDRFGKASKIIRDSISAFYGVLGVAKVHEKESKFKRLAEITRTSGDYVKTLILRASAEEKENEYKIHLVPYFQSHKTACQGRYTSFHSLDPKKEGCLLGWLGDREAEVEKWQNKPHPWSQILDKLACEEWKMDELAPILNKKMQSLV